MSKFILHLLILFLYVLPLSGQDIQNASNNWYFGDRAGLDFNTSPPTALTDGQLNTQEGVATISNNNGELLFYTDGITVWDRMHQAMPSANGTLNGHWSSTQSAIIVPNLMDPDIYYIFTTDELGGSDGLSYTSIDMSLAGNGSLSSPLGNVISGELNIQLATPVTEKVTGILKSDNSGYWIIAHGWNNNRFYAYEVTCSGLNTTPVISDVGNVHSGNAINAVGYMKATVDGQNLALVNRNNGTIDVYDFDNTSGIVSNEFEIKPNDPLIYGIEFSFSGDYLFIGGTDIISRYDMNSGILTNIEIDDPSEVNNTNVVRALQLGPDENIYVSVRNLKYISAIYNPEDNNPILTVNAIHLDPDNEGRNCRFGLPNIFYFDIVPLDSVTLITCPNGQVEYNGEFFQAGSINEINLIGTDGCDSTVILTVAIFEVNNEVLEVEACEGSFYDYNGIQILAGSQESFSSTDSNGCDSMITVIVVALEIHDEVLEVEACEGSFYDYNGIQIPAGTQESFNYTNSFGCDSTVNIIVEALEIHDEVLEVEACEGSFYDYNGIQIPAGTQESFNYTNSFGCDSTVNIIVEALEIHDEVLEVEACEGSFYDYNGIQIPAGTQESFNYTNSFGCDSTVNIIVEALEIHDEVLEVEACEGSFYDYNGIQILAGTQETFTYVDINGCDSLITIIVNNLTAPYADAQIQDTLTCVNLNITIQGSASSGNGPIEYDWQFGGNSISINEDIIVSEPGIYTLIITDIANGCTDETHVEVLQDIQEPTAIVATSGLITCTSTTVTLDGTGSSGSGTLNYDWQDSNGNSIGTNSTIDVNAVGNYTLIVTDISNGCTAYNSILVAGDDGTKIGNFLFQDGNENGIQEPWEAGVANIYVELYSTGPDGIQSTIDDIQIDWEMTGGNGMYLFECVEPGQYYIKYGINTDTYTFSPQYQGNDDELDSNVDPYTATTESFTVIQGMPHDLSLDAGVYIVCDDYTYGGTIGSNQIICSGDEPEILHTVIPPSGGSGIAEYMWLKSTSGVSWFGIPNSNTENYNPGPLYTTTYFIRCIRREGCNSFISESENQVVITVLPGDDEYCSEDNIDNPDPVEVFFVSEDQSIKAYPNPVSNILKIKTSFVRDSSSSLYLYNSMGQLLDVIKIEAQENPKEINMKNYDVGLYFLHIPETKSDSYKVLKIIKE